MCRFTADDVRIQTSEGLPSADPSDPIPSYRHRVFLPSGSRPQAIV